MRKCFVLLALLAAVSCVKEGLDDLGPVSDTFTLNLTASAPESSADTKTQVLDDLSVVWNSDDQIKVCFPINFGLYNNSGKTIYGVSGVFATSSEDMSSNADFTCNTWDVNLLEEINGNSKYNAVGYAFYPSTVEFSHSTDNYYNGNYNSASASYVIPSEQNAVEGSFDKNLNPAYAVVDRDEIVAGTATAQFHNLAALVRINLGENIDNVKEIRINTANASASTVCGTLNFTISKDNAQPGITTALKNNYDATPVILKKENGEKFQAGQTYYAVIAPGRTHVGLKLTFVDENGAQVEKTVTFDEYWTVKASDCWTINVKNPIVFAEPTVLEVDSNSFDASYAAGSKTFNVTASDDWTVAVTSYNATWIRVSPASGSGDGSFTISVDENTDPISSRSAQVTLTSNEKSVTIDIRQDYKKYYIVEQLTKAAQMEDGGMYVIGFKDAASYYWQVGTTGVVSRVYKSNTSNGFTENQVFKFEKTNYSNPNSNYNSFACGFLYSPYVGQYFDYYTLNFTSGYNCDIVFLNNYGTEDTADMDLIQYYDTTNGYVYWDTSKSKLQFGSSAKSYRKFYVYKVEAR